MITYLTYGLTLLSAVRVVFGCALIVLFVTDLQHKILPNSITLPGIVLGFVCSFFLPPGWVSSLIGLIVGGGFLLAIAEAYYRFRGQEGLGMGDVKLLAMIGAFLGWKLVLLTLVFASFTGSLAGGVMIASGRGSMKYALPFGTFLAVGALLAADVGRSDRRLVLRLLPVNPQAYALLGFTALVAVLVAVVTWALLRFVSAARDTRHRLRDSGESPLLSIALQDGDSETASAGTRDDRAGRSVRSAQHADRQQPHGRSARRRSRRPRADRESGRTEDARHHGGRRGFTHHALPPAAAPLAGVVNECLTTGESIVRRTLEVPQANEVTHLGVTSTRLGQGEGDAAGGVICLFSDLTAVIALEEQLRLKETLARLGELTAGIAHEFRNGLATIHGYGKLIDPAALPQQYKPYIEGIRQETVALGAGGDELPELCTAHAVVTRHIRSRRRGGARRR